MRHPILTAPVRPREVNVEFKKVVDFFRSHRLALHPEKTKFILFTNCSNVRAKNVDILLNFNNDNDVQSAHLSSSLTRVTSSSVVPAIKFLGIFIDPLLNFKFHIDTIISKISKSMYFLRSVKHVLTPPALKSIYYSLIHSHFVYGIHTWSCSNPGSISKLFLKQKMAIRIINNATFNAHTEPLFKKLNILPLSKLIDFFKLQFMHRFTLREIPSSFYTTWVKNEERRRQDELVLRNQNDLFIPPTRLASTENFPLSSFPRLWNDFPDTSIKNITSKSEFNRKLKIYFLSDLSENFVCDRLLCPNCHLLI